jgi:hypothetical protein
MKEVRDIKIDLLTCNQNPILDMFRKITDGMWIINCDVYNKDGLEFIYYNREREWIFYQDAKNGEFWAHYKRYWSILEREFRLEYEEIQALTKFLVEEALKREVTTSVLTVGDTYFEVEEALKREVGTPHRGGGSGSHRVEEALNREVGTSFPLRCKLASKVEEALKLEVCTPVVAIEEALNIEVATPETSTS